MRPSAGAETLYESEHTRVTRLVQGQTTVIRKEPLGTDAQPRLRHELEVLARLAGVPGAAQVAPVPSRLGSLLLVDEGGVPLRTTIGAWNPAEVTRVGAELARVVAAIHERGVIHGDINPGNILLAPPDGRPWLIDFDRATTVDGVLVSAPPEPGTMQAYLAPEQTGRTGRPVDQRADLYALGATLYHLATGRPPFTSTDPLWLSHDQLARVPTAPNELNPAVPARLSDIIMRLLEKEPDRRYQTAEGLRYDLTAVARTGDRLGSRDFPVRLRSPSRLVGRETETAELATAFGDAIGGRCRGVLVSGAPGVGKTSLIEALRPVVAERGGWFVSGKFDPHRQDRDFDGVRQALRALGGLLLAEPEDQVVEVCRRILDALGGNAGLIAAILPEFGLLLDVAPDPSIDDERAAQTRINRVGVDLLRAVVAPERPLVLVVDDLQWAQPTPIGFLHTLFTAPPVPGLLLIGAYREGDLPPDHPLRTLRSRWEELGVAPRQLRLANLTRANLTTLLVDVLRLSPARAHELAGLIEPRTRGNPFDTVELLNALRRDGALRHDGEGWRWDPVALRRALERAGATDPLAARAAALPVRTRTVLEQMACLGGQVDEHLMLAATGIPPADLRDRLAPALADGLVLATPGSASVRFQHDRIPESLLNSIEPGRRRAMRLDLARGLATDPDLVAVAAEQYLPVTDLVQDPAERDRVVALLRAAADQAMMMCYHGTVERLLSSAIRLYDGASVVPVIEMETRRLEALYSLGRLAEADEVFARIDALSTEPLQRSGAVMVQVSSLTNRGRMDDAFALGLAQLAGLGLTVPPAEALGRETEERLPLLYAWVEAADPARERERPESTDPLVLATATLVNRIMPAAFYGNRPLMGWLCLEAIRLWVTHGPNSALAGPVGHLPFVLTPLKGDYRTGYQALKLVLAVCEAKGYRLATALCQFLYAVGTGHWFEPLEENVRLAQRAREELVQGGDLAYGCYAYYISVHELLECASTLDTYAVEVESATTFAIRTGNTTAAQSYGAYRRLVRDLRGEAGPTGLDEAAERLARSDHPVGDPNTVANVQLTRALSAAIFDDGDGLARHIGEAVKLLPFLDASYPTALVQLLRALALADRLRSDPGDDQADLLVELDEVIAWLAERADDAPVNYHHLVLLCRAERAWAADDFQAAAAAFDAAQREVAAAHRPWHKAFILERTARFLMAFGMDHSGHQLLAAARRAYQSWGAEAKASRLDPWPHPAPVREPERAVYRGTAVTPGTIDLLGILEASRVLSSEKTVAGLQEKVAAICSAMTGATSVHIVLWDEATQRWSGPTDSFGPMSALRYVERTREPLVVADAVHDDRFARDPYLDGLDRCSLLVIPIINRGTFQALLLLENRLIRAAFSPDHLDGVLLIAGQLAVSLDNALIYTSLERKVAERTQELAVANERLARLSVTDPLTGLANRRRLEDVMAAESLLSVAMVDVDHFKPYNDHFGHPAGDDCLRLIASELARNVRDTDLVARYGGEEFAVVLPNTDLATAGRLAERLRAAIEALAIPHPLATDRVVTVSIGLGAITRTHRVGRDQLIREADEALYRAKRLGRNRVQPTAA